MKNSFCFIVNTSSDRERAGPLFRDRLNYVKRKFPDSHYIFIKEEDTIEEYASRAAEDYKYVVAAGGDGTVQQVAKALIRTNAILGVLPLGSGNDFAKSIGLPLQFEEDLTILLNKRTELIDVIETGDGLFLNTFGMGVDGLTNYYASISSIESGHFRYFVSAVKALFRSEIFRYECMINGAHMEGNARMIVVANGAMEGGKYKISPESDNSDGIVEVVIVGDAPLLRILVEFLKLSAGHPFSDKIVQTKRGTSSVFIKLNKEVYAHADGEIVPPKKSFSFSIQKQAISVITGR